MDLARGTVTACPSASPSSASGCSAHSTCPVNGRPVVVDTRKALAIVALVAAESRPFARDELAAMFWPDADDEAARGALRRTLSALRTAIGPEGLIIERARVSLDPTACYVDLDELERLAASDRLSDLEAAVTLARGPFLAGFALRDSPDFDDWQAARATRVERLVGDLLDRLASARSVGGDPSGAIEAARRRVELDPLDEPGQRRVMDLLARSGDRAGAIRQYRSLVALFDRELGVAPLRETTELYEAIREDRVVRDVDGEMAVAEPGSPETVASHLGDVPVRPRLVGRDRDLAAILHATRMATPDGRVVVVEGEAGIGKTALVETAVDAIRARGGIVLAARGYPGEQGIPYGPIAELLRAGLTMPGGLDRLAVLDDGSRFEIGRLLELPEPIRPPDQPSRTAGGSARVRLLDAVVRALAALVAGPASGAIWIDDLHLVDDPTREAVMYLARRLAGRALVLIVAWRREDLTVEGVASADDLVRMPGTLCLSLDRLDRAAVAEMVRAARPADGATDAYIDALAADSEGLPLHIAEVLASGEDPGASVPGGVRALLRERIASVDETAGQVLTAAAVIGRVFDLMTVRYASGRSEEETVQALEDLVRRGLIREYPDPVGGSVRFDFSHGNVRDATYDGTSLARRRLLHRRTAEAYRNEPSAAARDDIAWHVLIAGHEREAGRPLQAADAYRAAAEGAQAVFANREAIRHLDAALALGHPAASSLHAHIGELQARLGEYPAAVEALETAAALADADELPGIELALGRVHRRRGDLAGAASHLDAALGSPDLDPGTRVRALVERSAVSLQAGALDEAGDTARLALATANEVDDAAGAGMAERSLGLVAMGRGDLVSARAALDRSADRAADDPDPTALIAATTALALALAADGDIDEAVVIATKAIDACRRIGDRHLEAAVENHLADLLHEAGREAESMDHLKRAVALFAEVGDGGAGARTRDLDAGRLVGRWSGTGSGQRCRWMRAATS